MKRNGKRILFVVCMLCLFLAACGKNKYANSPYLGTWNATSAEYAGIAMTQDDFGSYVLTLEADGKASLEENGDAHSGVWEELEGGGIRLDKDDDLTLSDENGTLVLEMDGVRFIFEKA